MKIVVTLVLIVVGTLILSGCTTTGSRVNQEVVQDTVRPTNVHEATLEIEGMTCTSCALGVEYQLKKVEGVLDAKISYEKGIGYVTYDADKVIVETIVQASDVYPISVIEDKPVQ